MTDSEKLPIIGSSSINAHSQESGFNELDEEGAAGGEGQHVQQSASAGGRTRSGTGSYLTTVKEDEELLEVSSAVGDQGSGSLHPIRRSRALSNRFHSSLQKIRGFTQQSIHEVPSDDRNNSAFTAGFNVTNLIQGIGIMGVPYAVSRGSWGSIIVICVVAILCCFTGCMLIDCLYTTCPRTGRRVRYLKSYPDVGAVVWPRFGRRIVTLVSVTEMFGGMCLYIILLASTSSSLMKDKVPSLNIYHWSCITTYATLPLTFITRMSIISWFSMIAVICLMSSIATVIAFCFVNWAQLSVDHMPAFDASTFPVSFGIIVFSYCAHAVFPGIEESMRAPRSYPRMLTIAFVIAAIVKSLMGVMAVLIFGSGTEQEFGKNLEVDPNFSIAANSLIFVNVFFSMPLVIFVVVERFDAVFISHFNSVFHRGGSLHWLWIFLTRSLIVTAGLLLSMLVPHFALLMGLVGSFTGTCLCFIFPAWFHLSLKGRKMPFLSKAARVFVIIFGIVCGGIGLVFSAIELQRKMSE